MLFSFFFFNDTATTEIYTLSLHDALPISHPPDTTQAGIVAFPPSPFGMRAAKLEDRKSTRLNSSHLVISYAVFCLKKKKTNRTSLCLVATTRLSQLIIEYLTTCSRELSTV